MLYHLPYSININIVTYFLAPKDHKIYQENYIANCSQFLGKINILLMRTKSFACQCKWQLLQFELKINNASEVFINIYFKKNFMQIKC